MPPEMTDTAPKFWQSALPRIEVWRSLLGLLLIHVGFFVATFAIILLGGAMLGASPPSILRADTPAKIMVFFSTFAGYHLGLWGVVTFLHKRPYRSLFGPEGRLHWRHFAYGLVVASGLSALLTGVEMAGILALGTDAASMPEATRNLDLYTWSSILLPVLVLIFIQIMAEELVFRGYLLQQLRARFSSVWIWAVAPSVLFGLLHMDLATYGNNAYFYVLHTTVIGIILALVTLRTGNIGAAAGLHMANNAALLLLGNEGSLDGASLYLSNPNLHSSYVGLSMFAQTVASTVAFLIWWFWARPTTNADKQLQMPSGKIN